MGQAHPWLPTVTLGSRVMGPNETGWVERAVRCLAGTGLSGDQQIDAVLWCPHVRMAHSLSTAGSFPWDAERRLTEPMTDVLPSADDFPAILAAIDGAAGRPVRDVTDGIGLECILHGIEHQIRVARA